MLKYEGKKTYSSLVGAVIYGGCICFIWFSLYFDFMADAYIWILLTILGIQKYKKTGNWILFLISATLTVSNSFYFGFISFVFYAIFIIVFFQNKGATLKERMFFYLNVLGFPMTILIVFAFPWKQLFLLTRKKTILASILFILCLIPYSGSFFNGFSYTSERWYYLFIFSVAYAIPDWLGENDRLKNAKINFL